MNNNISKIIHIIDFDNSIKTPSSVSSILPYFSSTTIIINHSKFGGISVKPKHDTACHES